MTQADEYKSFISAVVTNAETALHREKIAKEHIENVVSALRIAQSELALAQRTAYLAQIDLDNIASHVEFLVGDGHSSSNLLEASWELNSARETVGTFISSITGKQEEIGNAIRALSDNEDMQKVAKRMHRAIAKLNSYKEVI